jgi:hypothetical protein
MYYKLEYALLFVVQNLHYLETGPPMPYYQYFPIQ